MSKRNKPSKPELLAPCGNAKTLKAAIEAGADAVYLGAGKFSARAFAGNFDDSGLAAGIKYASSANVKVHLAINTLMTDRELHDAMGIVDHAYHAGAAAFIVQDLGLAGMILHRYPDALLHASTQMTARSLSDVTALGSLGFKRVVIARELSREEIRRIAANTHVELEVFVHGALCSSYSGQCLISSFIGGRSANRGKCAQPCRLPYTHLTLKALDDCEDFCSSARKCRHGLPRGKQGGADAAIVQKDRKQLVVLGSNEYHSSGGRSGVLLSLKDLCLIDYLDELGDMGVASLKIEGRMKGEDYVRAVVGAYRKVLDGGSLSEQERAKMLKVFDRGGYTDGYYTGSRAGMYMSALSNPYGKGPGHAH